MMAFYEDELICDFAEEYHVLDYRSLSPTLAAKLAFGLRDDSRVKAKMNGFTSTLDVILNALTVDYLATLAWFQSEDGNKKRGRPESIYKILSEREKPKEYVGFNSADDFKRARKRLLNGG